MCMHACAFRVYAPRGSLVRLRRVPDRAGSAAEFVDGTRGAHVSISGVSGIATKTSFAMFLLHSIIGCGVLKGEAHNVNALAIAEAACEIAHKAFPRKRPASRR